MIEAASDGRGEARWWDGALTVIRAEAKDTGGQMTVVDITEPPGAVAPEHVHTNEDEGFWVIDGDVTFRVGGETLSAGPGDFAFGPRGIPHSYTVGGDGCRMLFILTPGGFEDVVRRMSEPAKSWTMPPAEGG